MEGTLQKASETLQKMAIIIVVVAISISVTSLFSNALGESPQLATLSAQEMGQL